MRSVLNVPNPDAWLRDNLHSMDHAQMEAKIAEIEAKSPVLESENQARINAGNAVKDAKARLKSADCSTLVSPIVKDMCIILKR